MAQQSYKKFVASAATATLVASALIPVASASANVTTSAFTDVPAKYKDAVDFVVSNNISSGLTATSYGVDKQIKRVDAASMIAAAAGLNDKDAPASGFKDVPARAAVAVNSLKAAGVVSGKSATNFGSQDNITRGEAAIMLQKAFKLKAGDTKNSFTDVKDSYDAAVDALVANKVTNGINATQFGTGNPIKRGDFAQFLFALKDQIVVANAVETVTVVNETTTTAKLKVANKDLTAADFKVLVDGEVVTPEKVESDAKGEVYTITHATLKGKKGVLSVNGKQADFDFVSGVQVESVKAINAKTLEVKFNKPVDTAKAVFEVKRGTVKPTVKAPVFSEDKMTATIEANTALAAGDYTVTVTGLSDDAISGKTTVAAEKLTKISFLSEVAVISGNDIIGKVSAENQYGEDITSKLATASNSNITVTSSKGTGTHTIDKDGNLKVLGGAAGVFKVDDKVVVTIVDSATGITATQTLKVAQAAAVESIVLGEIKTDDVELAKKPLNVANMSANAAKYYVPVTIKDQYGNTLKASELTGVTVVSSNGSIVNTDGFEDTKNGTVIKLKAPAAVATNGTAVLTVIASGTGKTANTSIVVKENSKLDTVTLESPSTVLKENVDAVLPISITNTYGEDVALKDVTVGGSNTALELNNANTKISAIGATLKVEQDYVNKKAVLKVTPTQKNVTITVVTATGKSQVLNLVAEPTPVVAGIKGLDKDFVSLLANDATLNTNLKNGVKFVDQYGEDIAAPTYDATDAANTTNDLDFTIKEKDANNVTNFTAASGQVDSTANAGTETYEVVLKDGTKVVDTLDVTFTVVDADKLTAFGIDDLNKFYTGATSASHDQQVKIHGISNGKKVVINQDMIADVTANNGLDIANDGAFTAKLIDTKNEDVASKLTVLVENKDNTYAVTKDVVYSSAAPKAQSLVTEYDGVEVKGGAVQVPSAELNKSVVPTGTPLSNSKLQFVAEDQYGVQSAVANYNVVATNNGATGVFTTAGVGSGFIPSDAGKTLNLNVRIDGILQTVKVIVTP